MGASRPSTFEFSDLGVGQLCSQKITNVAAACGLSSLRPMEAIL